MGTTHSVFRIDGCTVYGKKGDEHVFRVNGDAIINAEQSCRLQRLKTKFGDEYLVRTNGNYTLTLEYPRPHLDFEAFEEVDGFDILLRPANPGGKSTQEYWIHDAKPDTIDLNNNWFFRITDNDGDNLYYLHQKAYA